MFLPKHLGILLLMTATIFIMSCTKQDNQSNRPIPPVDSSMSVNDPAVSIYAGGNDTLFSFDAVDGSKKWAVSIKSHISSSPAYWNGYVYLGSDDGVLYAFDTTGKLKWSLQTNAGFTETSPMVDNGIVYINSGTHAYAIDGVTGNIKWSFAGQYLAYTNLVVHDGTVYFNDFILYALDALKGTLKWSYFSGSSLSPIISGNKLYTTGGQNDLVVLDATTGVYLWGKQNDIEFLGVNQMNLKYGSLYVMSQSVLSCLDTSDGSEKWRIPVSNYSETIKCGPSPVIYDSLLLIVSSTISAYNAFSGNYLWSAVADHGFVGDLTVVNNTMFYAILLAEQPITGPSGHLYAVDIKDPNPVRTPKWISPQALYIVGPPCVVTRSGKMYRFAEGYN